jgi:hypothetical protein
VRNSRDRLRNLLLGIYVVACMAALTWPAYAWFGNSIRPYVLGLPLSLAWVVAWVVMTFVVLVIYHGTGGDERG